MTSTEPRGYRPAFRERVLRGRRQPSASALTLVPRKSTPGRHERAGDVEALREALIEVWRDYDARAHLHRDDAARDIADVLEALTLESLAPTASAGPEVHAAHHEQLARRDAWLKDIAKQARKIRGRPSDKDRRSVALEHERTVAARATVSGDWEAYARALVRRIVLSSDARAFASIAPSLPTAAQLWNATTHRTELERLEPYVIKVHTAIARLFQRRAESFRQEEPTAELVVEYAFGALGFKRPSNLFNFEAQRAVRNAPE